MNVPFAVRRTRAAELVFDLLDPLPYALFVAALIFDAIYANSGEILWTKAAAWLICIGLLFAVIPRLIDLARVWFGPRPRAAGRVMSFWLNALAILAATANAFVHSRDAYGSMPEGLLLSLLTVVLMICGKVATTLRPHTPPLEQR